MKMCTDIEAVQIVSALREFRDAANDVLGCSLDEEPQALKRLKLAVDGSEDAFEAVLQWEPWS